VTLPELDAAFEAATQEYQAAHTQWEQAEIRLMEAKEKLVKARRGVRRAFLDSAIREGNIARGLS
jgi:hypothetical protein